MKKQIIFSAAVLFTAGIIVMSGCKKDDTTPPVITLIGDASVTSVLNATYTDPGATAEDDKDGDLTLSIISSGWVASDKDLAGTYIITYSVTDAAGNTGTATRTVIVKNDADAMTGTYSCTIAAPNAWGPYMQTITASTTKNNRILFSKFGDYTGNTNIHADVTGTSIDLPSQVALQVGNPATDRTFVGTGTTNSTGFTLTYSETTSTGSKSFTETFVK
ncbi:MAG: DUF5011 domain-containing protein [Bacteroidetes bacterium]|nr:DUF5011 domain-containing protein [Bacteroidota bacterium]